MEEEHATTPPAEEGTNLPVSPPPPPAPTAQGMTANTWAMIVHLSALAGFIVPFGNILGPLITWIIKKDEMPEVDRHGKAALNYQISLAIYVTVASAIAFALTFVLIGFVLLPLVGIAGAVLMALFPLLAGMKANEGGWYEYPLMIRFIK